MSEVLAFEIIEDGIGQDVALGAVVFDVGDRNVTALDVYEGCHVPVYPSIPCLPVAEVSPLRAEEPVEHCQECAVLLLQRWWRRASAC